MLYSKQSPENNTITSPVYKAVYLSSHDTYSRSTSIILRGLSSAHYTVHFFEINSHGLPGKLLAFSLTNDFEFSISLYNNSKPIPSKISK